MYELIRVTEAFTLIWIDAYYFLWVYTLKYTLPKSVSEMLAKTIRGNIGDAKNYLLKELTKNIEEMKGQPEIVVRPK